MFAALGPESLDLLALANDDAIAPGGQQHRRLLGQQLCRADAPYGDLLRTDEQAAVGFADKVADAVNRPIILAGGRPQLHPEEGALRKVDLANVAQRGELPIDEDVDADAQPRGLLRLLLLLGNHSNRF